MKNVVAKSFVAPRLLQPDPDIILYVFPCTDKSNFSLSLHDIDDAQFIQPVLKNCSFSTKVNMICFEKDAGYENGKTGIIYNGWECYNQHHLIFSGGAMTCFNYARFASS